MARTEATFAVALSALYGALKLTRPVFVSEATWQAAEALLALARRDLALTAKTHEGRADELGVSVSTEREWRTSGWLVDMREPSTARPTYMTHEEAAASVKAGRKRGR